MGVDGSCRADTLVRQVFIIPTRREESAGSYQGIGFSHATCRAPDDAAPIGRNCHQPVRC
jgi:hypothetical protein